MNKEAALLELEKTRGQMLNMVNSRIDALKIRIENGEDINYDTLSAIGTLYTLNISPMFFKGTKPTALYFGDERVPAKTWRKAYTLILQRCADISLHKISARRLRYR